MYVIGGLKWISYGQHDYFKLEQGTKMCIMLETTQRQLFREAKGIKEYIVNDSNGQIQQAKLHRALDNV